MEFNASSGGDDKESFTIEKCKGAYTVTINGKQVTVEERELSGLMKTKRKKKKKRTEQLTPHPPEEADYDIEDELIIVEKDGSLNKVRVGFNEPVFLTDDEVPQFLYLTRLERKEKIRNSLRSPKRLRPGGRVYIPSSNDREASPLDQKEAHIMPTSPIIDRYMSAENFDHFVEKCEEGSPKSPSVTVKFQSEESQRAMEMLRRKCEELEQRYTEEVTRRVLKESSAAFIGEVTSQIDYEKVLDRQSKKQLLRKAENLMTFTVSSAPPNDINDDDDDNSIEVIDMSETADISDEYRNGRAQETMDMQTLCALSVVDNILNTGRDFVASKCITSLCAASIVNDIMDSMMKHELVKPLSAEVATAFVESKMAACVADVLATRKILVNTTKDMTSTVVNRMFDKAIARVSGTDTLDFTIPDLPLVRDEDGDGSGSAGHHINKSELRRRYQDMLSILQKEYEDSQRLVRDLHMKKLMMEASGVADTQSPLETTANLDGITMSASGDAPECDQEKVNEFADVFEEAVVDYEADEYVEDLMEFLDFQKVGMIYEGDDMKKLDEQMTGYPDGGSEASYSDPEDAESVLEIKSYFFTDGLLHPPLQSLSVDGAMGFVDSMSDIGNDSIVSFAPNMYGEQGFEDAVGYGSGDDGYCNMEKESSLMEDCGSLLFEEQPLEDNEVRIGLLEAEIGRLAQDKLIVRRNWGSKV